MIFDLWETLVDWPRNDEHYAALAAGLGVELERFREAWIAARAGRELGPLADGFRSVATELAIENADIDALVDLRREYTRTVLKPRPGVVDTLRELRGRGFRIGLISACTEDVPDVWRETELADLFDDAVFSCSVGMSKPDPRIYELACERLGVRPAEAVFVGDGANDELAGADRVGMRAVLIHRPAEEPQWDGLRDWPGPRITSIPEILEVVGPAS